ncbi:MAG: hypothetical protein HY397_00915 [Candidatus Doudnabacteria bacterium]|nr:hypothetical protein [Candidatus Doudnabacteria bacterium]
MTDNSHSCQALVLTCIDFRFHEQIARLLHDQGLESFDLKCDAGAVKYLVSNEKPEVKNWILENFRIAQGLHHIQRAILINHYDCGAYGGNAAFKSHAQQLEFHKNQLMQAKDLLKNEFPGLHVDTYFAALEEESRVKLVAI